MSGEKTLTVRGAARRTALLNAAVDVVAEGGSAALTHRAVAARADASLASVTYHFASIDDLRSSMFEHAGRTIGDELAVVTERAAGSTDAMPEVVADFCVAILWQHRNATLAFNEMIVAAAHDSRLQPTFQFFHGRLGELLAPCVGGEQAGRTASTAVIGTLVTSVAYPDLSPETVRASVTALLQRLRTQTTTG